LTGSTETGARVECSTKSAKQVSICNEQRVVMGFIYRPNDSMIERISQNTSCKTNCHSRRDLTVDQFQFNINHPKKNEINSWLLVKSFKQTWCAADQGKPENVTLLCNHAQHSLT
jgi:hypothetical protein